MSFPIENGDVPSFFVGYGHFPYPLVGSTTRKFQQPMPSGAKLLIIWRIRASFGVGITVPVVIDIIPFTSDATPRNQAHTHPHRNLQIYKKPGISVGMWFNVNIY